MVVGTVLVIFAIGLYALPDAFAEVSPPLEKELLIQNICAGNTHHSSWFTFLGIDDSQNILFINNDKLVCVLDQNDNVSTFTLNDTDMNGDGHLIY